MINLEAFSTIIKIAKNSVPVAEAVIAQLPSITGPITDDLKVAADDVTKIAADLEAAYEKLEALVKESTNPPAAA